MNTLNFNAADWVYVADPMGRVGQGYYKNRNNSSQTITVAEFEKRRSQPVKVQSQDQEQIINIKSAPKPAEAAQTAQNLTPWSNPVMGEQSVTFDQPNQEEKQANQKIAPTKGKAEQKQSDKQKQQKNETPEGTSGAKEGADSISETNADSSSGESGETVICTELVRQGFMDKREQRLSYLYAQKYLGEAFMAGYHFWAVPYVRLMQHSPLATALMRPFVKHRTDEILYRMGKAEKGSYFGRAICAVHDPICKGVGYFVGGINKTSLQYQ